MATLQEIQQNLEKMALTVSERTGKDIVEVRKIVDQDFRSRVERIIDRCKKKLRKSGSKEANIQIVPSEGEKILIVDPKRDKGFLVDVRFEGEEVSIEGVPVDILFKLPNGGMSREIDKC